MLVADCGIDEGRSAWQPDSQMIVSAFQVLTERNSTHVIKTIATGFLVKDERDQHDLETTVLRVHSRRENDLGEFEYETEMEDGSREWLGSRAFFSDDGTVTDCFLEFAQREDLQRALELYSITNLKEMCKGQKLKSGGVQKARVLKRVLKHYVREKVLDNSLPRSY